MIPCVPIYDIAKKYRIRFRAFAANCLFLCNDTNCVNQGIE